MSMNKRMGIVRIVVRCCNARGWGRWTSRPYLYYATLVVALVTLDGSKGGGGGWASERGPGDVYGWGVENFEQKGGM